MAYIWEVPAGCSDPGSWVPHPIPQLQPAIKPQTATPLSVVRKHTTDSQLCPSTLPY